MNDSKRNESRKAAVVVEDGQAVLEIAYNASRDGVEECDSNRFSEVVGGMREPLSEAEARQSCVDHAQGWVNSMRAEGWEIGAWDAQGNCY